MSADGAGNTDAYPKNIIFTIKDTKSWAPVATLLARDIQKLSKLLSKVFERSVYWNEYKTKRQNNNTTNEYRYFLQSNYVEVNTLFLLVYSNQDNNSKRFKTRRYYLPKSIIDNYDVIINGKNFYDQLIQI